jgi:hypothetical protein
VMGVAGLARAGELDAARSRASRGRARRPHRASARRDAGSSDCALRGDRMQRLRSPAR